MGRSLRIGGRREEGEDAGEIDERFLSEKVAKLFARECVTNAAVIVIGSSTEEDASENLRPSCEVDSGMKTLGFVLLELRTETSLRGSQKSLRLG